MVATLLRPAYYASGAEGWARLPVGSATVGVRTLSDRSGQVFALAPTADDANTRVLVDATLSAGPLARLIDANHIIDTATSHRRRFALRRELPPFRTTISLGMQRLAADQLEDQRGAVVVIEPLTGEILAFVATTVDPETGEIYALPAGSIFKPVLYSSALDHDTLPPDRVFEIEAAPFRGIQNSGDASCGGAIIDVIAFSCNIAAARTAAELVDQDGPAALADTAAGFGFTGSRELQLVEAASLGPAFADGDNIASTAIGQLDVRTNPFTAATIAATIANGGLRPRLTLVPDQPQLTRVVSPEAAALVEDGMEQVLQRGTAQTSAAAITVPAAVKTGTAQAGLDGFYTHGWAIAYAPSDQEPELAVAVLLEGRAEQSRTGPEAADLAVTLLARGLEVDLGETPS